MMRQRGFTFLLVIVVLASLGALAAAGMLQAMNSNAGKREDLDRKFARAKAALVAYVADMGRLPCPADPTTSTGDEVRAASTKTCQNPQGTLPWKSLGLGPDDSFDPWGFKISYRVYDGNAGSLVQDLGTSMVECDPTQTQNPTNVDGQNGGGLCKGNKKTIPGAASDAAGASFLGGKGFSVSDFGNATVGIAYVLISHGPSGRGGYTAANTQVAAPVSANEIANMTATGPFVATSASASTVSPDDPAHFDDVIAYATISDVIAKAGRGARTWP